MNDDIRTPDEVRQDIEETRDELADTAAALAQKADVKARAKDRVDEVKADVREKAETVKEKVTPSSNGAGPGDDSGLAASAQQAAGTAREHVRKNPIPAAALASALLGFALGYLAANR